MQRADLIGQNLYDIHSQEQFETEINNLSDTIEDLKYRRKNGFQNSSSRILTFYKFLELKENLVQYWNFADYSKKAIFSKIVLWNPTLQGQEVANLSFKKPFLDDEEGGSDSYGALREVQLEPKFEKLWNRL